MILSKQQKAQVRWSKDPKAKARGGFWWTLLIYAVLFVVSELLRPKPNLENAKPAGLGDFQFPTATEDRVIPLVWGTIKIAGPNVVWYGDLRKEAITKKVKTGMFSSKRQTVGYRYKLGVQMALCRGPVDRLDGLWVGETKILSDNQIRNIQLLNAGSSYQVGDLLTITGGSGTLATVKVTEVFRFTGIITKFSVKSHGDYTTLPSGTTGSGTGGSGSGATFSFARGTVAANGTFSFDLPNLFGGDEEGNGGIRGTLKFWAGGASQAVSSYLDDFQNIGAGNKTPAYRGTCWVGPNSAPFYLGNSANIEPWAFEVRRIINGLALTTGREIVNVKDCNPANVLYEIFTNTEWGMGHPASDIDTASFTTAGNTLFDEGNGFSFLLDREMEALELIDLIEQQISGKVFFNQVLSQWQLKLARDDYDIDTINVITESNALEIRDFTRGSWEDTTNIVRVKFTNRSNEYKDTFSLAQDSANIQLQDGVNVSTTVNMPGVKDTTLATNIAWRTLRTLSYPLAKATFVMDRSFYDTNPVDVFAFTSAKFGLTKLPMRVIKVDLGSLEDNKVIIDCVQDVFFFQVGSFGDAGGTGWEDPIDSLLPFLAAEQIAMEAPRGLTLRSDPATLDPIIFAAARRRGAESGFRIMGRSASGTPSGSFGSMGESVGFMLIGELNAALAAGQVTPTTTITITNAVDEQADIIDAFFAASGVEDQGTNLVNMIYVHDGTNDGEFMLVESASVNGASNVDLDNVYRGVLDSAQQAFASGDKVYLVFAGANVSDTALVETDNVHVKLLPESSSDIVDIPSATQIALTMDKRVRRPYCPSEVTIGVARFATTVGLEQQGSGLDAVGFAVDFIRRDYRAQDEIPQLTTDAETLDATFPAANDTDHDMELREDPAGTNTLLITDADLTGTSNDQVRTAILHANAGVLPTRLSVVLTAKHDDGPDTDLTSRQDLIHEFDVTSGLTGDFELGDLLRNVASATYTVDAAVVHTVTIGTAFSGAGAGSGDVEININGGGWVQIIPQGSTSGVTAALSVSDTIQLRHDSTDTGHVTMMTLTGPGATSAWGIFYV